MCVCVHVCSWRKSRIFDKNKQISHFRSRLLERSTFEILIWFSLSACGCNCCCKHIFMHITVYRALYVYVYVQLIAQIFFRKCGVVACNMAVIAGVAIGGVRHQFQCHCRHRLLLPCQLRAIYIRFYMHIGAHWIMWSMCILAVKWNIFTWIFWLFLRHTAALLKCRKLWKH